MVPQGGPKKFVTQYRWIHVEYGALMFGIAAYVVGIVSQHQPDIGRSIRCRVIIKCVANALLTIGSAVARGTRIADCPNTDGLARSNRGGGIKPVLRSHAVGAGEPLRRAADRVVVARARLQSAYLHNMLVRDTQLSGGVR